MSKFDPPPTADPNRDVEHQNPQMPPEAHTNGHHQHQQQQYPNPPAAAKPNTMMTKPRPPMDLVNIVNMGLRIACLIFSFLAFVIIASNKGFDNTDEYSYLLAMGLISFVYSGFQTVKAVFLIATGKEIIPDQKISAPVDFALDQVLAYLLMSASSAAFVVTKAYKAMLDQASSAQASSLNGMFITKSDKDALAAQKVWADKAAAASSMLFFAFVTMMVCALVSIHKLLLKKSAKSAAGAPAKN